MTANAQYKAKQFDLSGLNGISDRLIRNLRSGHSINFDQDNSSRQLYHSERALWLFIESNSRIVDKSPRARWHFILKSRRGLLTKQANSVTTP